MKLSYFALTLFLSLSDAFAQTPNPQCAQDTQNSITHIIEKAQKNYPQWSSLQKNSLEDTFIQARHISWSTLSPTETQHEFLIAQQRHTDDLYQASIYTEISKNPSVNKESRAKAWDDAQFWWTKAKIDQQTIHFHSCYWAKP